MRKILVYTSTRAEYGLLRGVMQEIQATDALQLQLLASGMHLSPEFGMTIDEIYADGFHPDETVEILLSADSPTAICKSMGIALIDYGEALQRLTNLLFYPRPPSIALTGLRDLEDLIRSHAAWVDEALEQEKKARDGKWTETIAACPVKYPQRGQRSSPRETFVGPLFLWGEFHRGAKMRPFLGVSVGNSTCCRGPTPTPLARQESP